MENNQIKVAPLRSRQIQKYSYKTFQVLFLALILRIITLAERQPTTFGRVYAYCVASYFIFHFCINIGMVIGLCPVIGIPLPFFSYGGSSLWGFTILLSIMLRLDAARVNKLHG
jgi:rod shape determining protein RodA